MGFSSSSFQERLGFFITTHALSLVLLINSVLISSCSAWTCSSESEDALLGFKQMLIDPEGLLAEWVQGTNCCTWPYVTCRASDGAVIALSITGSARPNQQPYRNNTYSISNFGSTLTDLKDLETLQLQWIFFNSPIPSAWGNSFSDNLTVITVNDCNLESSIPSNLGDISNLQHLDLQSNYLTGTIPQQLCNLRHLVYLDVSYNDLQSGAVPSCLNKSGLYLSTGNQEVGLSPNHGAHSQHIITSTFFLSSFLGASASVLLLFFVN